MKALLIDGPRAGQVYEIVGTEQALKFPVLPASMAMALDDNRAHAALEVDTYERRVAFSNDRVIYGYAGRK